MGFTRAIVERDPSGAPTLDDDEESVLLCQPRTRLFVSASNQPMGEGSLLITTKRVLWLLDDASTSAQASGYQVGYHSLLMHAISRDTEHFNHPSIYCQLEQPQDEDSDEEEDEEDGGQQSAGAQRDGAGAEFAGDAALEAGEARFVPDDPAAGQSRSASPSPSPASPCVLTSVLHHALFSRSVDVLYAKMSEGAELNPDEVEGRRIRAPNRRAPPLTPVPSSLPLTLRPPTPLPSSVCCLSCPADGEGDFIFEASSLQVAPGINVQALLGGSAPMEHAGEEYDEDEGEDEEGEGEGEEQGEGVDVAGLEVTGHRLPLSPRGPTTTMDDEEEEKIGNEDDVEHHEG